MSEDSAIVTTMFLLSCLKKYCPLWIALALTSCQSGPHWLAEVRGTSSVVPMRVKGSLPFVKVRVGGTLHEFLLDTGASDCVITPQMAKRLGLTTQKKVAVKTAAGDIVGLPTATLPRLEFGNLVFINVPVLVHDCAKPREVFPNLEGVVGFGLLKEFLLTMDYPDSKVVLTKGGSLPSTHPDVMPMRMQLGVPKVPITYEGRSTFVDIDTGSNGGLELDPALLGLRLSGALVPAGISMSIGSNYRTYSSRINGSLHLGRVEIVNPIVELTHGDQRIGGDVLRALVITFDAPNGRVAIASDESSFTGAPSDKLASPTRYTTGLAFDAQWKVKDVVPGTTAYTAGIKLGDQCVAINGQEPQKLGKEGYFEALGSGAPLNLQLLRGGQILTKSVTLQTWVE